MGRKRVWIGVIAGLLLLALGVSPAAARKGKPAATPRQVYLSSELASLPAGPEAIAPWEEEAVTISSSDLQLSTPKGTITCTVGLAAKVQLNREYNYLPVLLADETTTAPCTSPMSTAPIEFESRAWQLEFATSGKAQFCPTPFPYVVQCEPSVGGHGIALDIGSTACDYETKKAMEGSFDPAAFGSEGPNPVEVALGPVKFGLFLRQRGGAAHKACPRSAVLTVHLQIHTASHGALEARVVEAQRTTGPLCSLNAIGDRCTISYVNPDETEAREVRQVFMPQENPKLAGVLVRVPMAGECQGVAEAPSGTMVSPGASCTLTLERIGNPSEPVLSKEVHFGILTLSIPGGAPAVDESDIQ